MAVAAAKHHQLAIVRDSERVVLAAGDADDAVAFIDELGDERRLKHQCLLVVVAGLAIEAQLAVVVQAPGPDTSLVVNCERVVCAGGDFGDLGAALEVEATGAEGRCEGIAEDDATTELALLVGSPGLDLALAVQGENMVGARSDIDDLRWLREENWGMLDANVLGETENTVRSLWYWLVN